MVFEVIAAAGLVLAGWLGLTCLRARREIKPAEPDVGKIIHLPGGDLQVRSDGSPNAPPLVLLHGFGGSLLWWEPAAQLLADDFHVLRFDLLGHGGSEKHAGDYSTAALARQVARGLERLGVKRAFVVGQSMGGLVAILLAEANPGLVERLVLVDTPLEHRFQRLNAIGKLAFMPVLGPALRAVASDRTLRRGLEVVFTEGFRAPDHLVHDSRRMTWRSFKQCDDGQDRLLRGTPPLRERLAALQVPVRLLWGREDHLWPLAASRTYRDLPNVEIIEIAGAGHTPMLDAPGETAHLIAEFAGAEPLAHAGGRNVTAAGSVDRRLFPFESRYLGLEGCQVHYIDEGSGPAILFLHGNPTWSFLYREIIAGLRPRFRCIALDYPGFGLSRAGPGYGFSAAEHARVVERFVVELDLRELTVMGQDWGGPIGLGVAARQFDRIAALVIANTFAWPLDRSLFFQSFSHVAGGAVGRELIQRFNAFVELSMPLGTSRTRVPEAVVEYYRRPFIDREARLPTWEFARQLLKARDYLREVKSGLALLSSRPTLILWGTRDIAFRRAARRRFERAFPNHRTVILPGVGHYLQEDAAAEVADAIATWHPLGGLATSDRPAARRLTGSQGS